MKLQNPNVITSERQNGRLRVQIDCSHDGKTDQTQRDRCNINSIMAKARLTGMMPNMDRIQKAQYGDFSNQEDYQTMCNKIAQAKEQFLELPSKIRDRFNNDPSQLIEFLNNPENEKEAIELGIRKAQPSPPIVPKTPEVPAAQPPAQPQTEPPAA